MMLKLNDTVFIPGIGAVTVTSVHIGSHMYDYTGTDDEGVLVYFDEGEYE